MRTLIVYASKTGTVKKCASLLAANLGCENCVLSDISLGEPDFSGYDCVVAGSYIRMGMTDKKINDFLIKLSENKDSPKFGIFLCGCLSEKVSEAITKNFSDTLLEKAVCVDFFGGELALEKQKGLDRLIVKSILKISESGQDFSVSATVDSEKIAYFAKEISE